LRVISKKATSL